MKRALYTYEKNPVYKYKEPCVLFWKEPYYTSLGLFAQATVTIWIIESPIPPATTHMHTYTCGKSPVFTWKEPCIHMKTALCTYENSPVHIYKKKPAIPLRGRSRWQQWRSLRSSRRSLLSWPTHTRPTCMWKEPYIHMKRALCTYKNIQKQPCVHTKTAMPYLFRAVDADNGDGLNHRVVDPSHHDPHACRGGGDRNAIPPLVQPAVRSEHICRICQKRWQETYWPACLPRRRRWECDTALGTDCSRLKVC